jgi:transcription elongation factor GreA
MSTVPMTPAGHKRLKEELEQLKSVERPKVIREIATAREHGDLRENAEYHAAKEKQGFIEGRIALIEDALARAEVIEPSRVAGDKIAFGAHIKLSNTATGEEVTYQLVGPMEADIDHGRISVSSPIAKAMVGKEVGDEVKVQTPNGTRVYEVLELSFDE